MDTRTDDEIRGDLSFLFDKGSQVLGARMATALAELGITPRDHCVLTKAESGRLTQREIAELALLDKTTMVVTVDHLERAGLARRTPSPTDRRARIVELTDAGRQVLRRARVITDGLYDEVLGVLPDGHRSALLDALVRLVGAGGPLGSPLPQSSAVR